MAYKRSDGRYGVMVYFTEKKAVDKIKRASKHLRRSMSTFLAIEGERAADQTLQKQEKQFPDGALGQVLQRD